MLTKPKRGEFWRDENGQVFTITCIAEHILTGEELIIYRNVGEPQIERLASPTVDFVYSHKKEKNLV